LEAYNHGIYIYIFVCFFLFVCFGATAPVGQGFLIHEVSRSHTMTGHSR